MKRHEIEYIERKIERMEQHELHVYYLTDPNILIFKNLKETTSPEALKWANRAWRNISELL